MNVTDTGFKGLLLIEPQVFSDMRGHLMELWRKTRYESAGIQREMVQDNLSWSSGGVLRGMHYQDPQSQAKLVFALQGEIFDAVVDLRWDSSTFSRWFGIRLNSSNRLQLYVPEGFAHGFCVLSDTALVAYKCTAEYCPAAEKSLAWDDPAIGIEWPIEHPLLSPKDRAAPRLSEIMPHRISSRMICETRAVPV